MSEQKIKYCDDCGVLISIKHQLYQRSDGQHFCDRCAVVNGQKLKESNQDFCSLCSFGENVYGQGPLTKYKDGKWYHIACKNRELAFDEMKDYKKNSWEDYAIVIFLILLLTTIIAAFLFIIFRGK